MSRKPITEGDLQHINDAVGSRRELDGAIVIVTGCAGFLGHYLTQYLCRYAGAHGLRRVIGLDNFMLGKPSWLLRLAEEFPQLLRLCSFDISRDRLEEIEEAQDARYVIHAASIASPTFYRQFSLETIDANVWGLRRLLDFYRGSEALRGLLFFSSSEIYGDPAPEFIPTAEDYRGNVACVGPRACYDESKRFGETLCDVFAKIHGMPITVARPFNNYGPGMRPGDQRLPADLADSIVAERDIDLLSDGSPTRTYCYVADAVAGYILCLLHGRYDCFNIGADGPEISVRDLAEIYRRSGQEMFGYAGKINYRPSRDQEYLTDNPNRRCPDISKARKELGYDPKIEISEGVRRHLEFLRHVREQEK